MSTHSHRTRLHQREIEAAQARAGRQLERRSASGIAGSRIIRGRITLPTPALVRNIHVCLRLGLQIISSRRETEDPIFAQIVRAHAAARLQELALASYVSISEHHDGNV